MSAKITREILEAYLYRKTKAHLKVTGHCRANQGIKNALRAGYDAIEHGTFMDNEALDLLLERNTPVVPALYFEQVSLECGPAIKMPPEQARSDAAACCSDTAP